MFYYFRRITTYFNSRIRFKIILPFALLILLVSILGVYFNTYLLTTSLGERSTQQLADASNIVANSLTQREKLHLSVLNAMVFTEGIDLEILAGNYNKLQDLLSPLIRSFDIDRVDVVSRDGTQLLAIYRESGANSSIDYLTTNGANLRDWIIWPNVYDVLRGTLDAHGDKLVMLETVEGHKMFLAIAPVRRNDKIVGAILVGSYIQDLLQTISQATLTEVSFYDIKGNLIGTTFSSKEVAPEVLTISALEIYTILTEGSNSDLLRSASLRGRDYRFLFHVFQAGGKPQGVYSVASSTSYITSYAQTGRNQAIIIFGTALVLVFAIGYITANTITTRVRHLMENAMAVASGDFTRRTGIEVDDEIGSLANSLDHMTESLASYTHALQKRIDELTALYEGSTAITIRSGLNLEDVLEAVTSSLKEVIRGTDEVIVYLLDESGQLLIPRASTTNELTDLPNLAFEEKGTVRAMLAAAKPQAIQLVDIGSHSLNGTFKREETFPAMIAPLIAGQEMAGMLLVILDETYPQTELMEEDNERLLGTMANQAAIAIKNAQLFQVIKQAYEEIAVLYQSSTTHLLGRSRPEDSYIVGSPIETPQKFYGRREVLNRALNALYTGNHIAIYGERRIGKTSLLHRLAFHLRQEQDGEYMFIPTFISLQLAPSEERFFYNIMREIRDSARKTEAASDPESNTTKRPLPVLRCDERYTDYDSLNMAYDLDTTLTTLESNLSKPTRIVLLLDEADQMNGYHPRTQGALRGLLMRFPRRVLIVWSGQAINRTWSLDTSPWYNLFKYEIRLEAFNEAEEVEARRLIREPVHGLLEYQDDAVTQILVYSERKPYAIQRLCATIVKQALVADRTLVTLQDVHHAYNILKHNDVAETAL